MTIRPRLPWAARAWIVAGLLATACTRTGDPASDPASPGPADLVLPENARGVTTAVARTAPVDDYLDVTGDIEPDPTRVVRVYAPVSGRVVNVGVRPADSVREGAALVTLASGDVAAARAAYRQAAADARVRGQELERAQLLYANDALPLRDLQHAQADAATGEAVFASAAERLRLLNLDTAGTSDVIAVPAPRNGVVLDLDVAPGEYVKSLDNATPLCTIADLSSVWAVGNVYEDALAGVRVGERVEVTVAAYPAARWRGRVSALADAIDSTTRTLKLRAVLDNPDRRLKPAMYASLRVIRGRRPAVVVPREAVVMEGTAAYLFIQTARGHFQRRAVVLGGGGAALDPDVEVTSGLAAGDTVVVQGVELLRAAAGASP
jgi:membrane fusion protein, heavy metal efflux system